MWCGITSRPAPCPHQREKCPPGFASNQKQMSQAVFHVCSIPAGTSDTDTRWFVHLSHSRCWVGYALIRGTNEGKVGMLLVWLSAQHNLLVHTLWRQRCLSAAVHSPDLYCKRLRFRKFSLLTGSRCMINNFMKCCARPLECCMAYLQQPTSSHTGNGSSMSNFSAWSHRRIA